MASLLVLGGVSAQETLADTSGQDINQDTGAESAPAASSGDDFFSRPTESKITFKRLGKSTTPEATQLSTADSTSNASPTTAAETPVTDAASSAQTELAADNGSAAQAAAVAAAVPMALDANATVPQTEEVVTPENLTVGENPTAAASAGNVTAEGSLNASDNITIPENVTPEGLPVAAAAVAAVEEEEETPDSEKDSEDLSWEDYPTDRIWREGMPLEYTWTPLSFSGFFYDLDDQVGTETLTITLDNQGDRTVDSGGLVYFSDVQEINFEYNDWGKFQVIGFMADKYFAGYVTSDVVDRDLSLINENELRRVLVDSDDDQTITTGSVLTLEEGYELRIKEIDINGNKVWLGLAKDGEEIDSKVVSPDGASTSTYKYEVDIGGRDTPLVMAHIENVFQGAESSLVTVNGLFQISDTYASVEDGDKYGEMEVVAVSDQGIEMQNEDSFTLRKDKTVNIMGDVGFEVADSDTVRFAPIVDRKGTYEIRGTIVDPSKVDEFVWNAYNFEGFYYDIDDDVGTEFLKVTLTGEKIEDGNLLYETSPQPVEFKFENWGKYDVIGFMADKYFAGYNNGTELTDEYSIINEGELRRVLMDSDDDVTLSSGSAMPLKEGYELQIKEVDLDGNKVWLALTKDGDEVGNKVVTPDSANVKSSTFVYEVSIGSEDVPIMAAHVASVFRGSEQDLATIDGVFQVSDSAESVEEGETHGKMEVDSLSDQGITMRNDGSISLGKGKELEIMGNLKFVVADNDERNFAPFATKVGEVEPLRINVPETVVNRTAQIEVISGTQGVSGVKVQVDGKDIGTTGTEGTISYTPRDAGTFQVKAQLTGYQDASGSIVVRSAAETRLLTLDLPSEVKKGQTFVMTVKGGLNATPMEDVNLTFDGRSIGVTDSKGTLSHSSDAVGQHSVKASREGYDDVTRTITVTTAVMVENVSVSEKPTAGKNVKVTASVRNTGTTEDSKELQFMVNGEKVDAKNVTLAAGESKEVVFEYRPKDPGAYSFEVDGRQNRVAVEEAKSNAMWIAVLLLILLIAGAGAYLYKTGQLETLKQSLQKRGGI
ncbi:MAG: S-layer protein [Methanosarcinales archaeon]|nr:S-layer protein [Methanosarcinales archaeon]